MRRTDEAKLFSGSADGGARTARLNEHGELQPVAIDESLTTLLFAPPCASSSPSAAHPSAARAEPDRGAPRPVAALFEMV